MHIPEHMLQGSICPITAVVSATGIIAAVYFARKANDKPTSVSFGAVVALIFAAQMMNFPIVSGTSGHLLGGVLAASLLGTPFAVLAIALVVTIQSLVFSDGGIAVLGANIFNMAILGAGMGGLLRSSLAIQWRGMRGKYLAVAVASWCSVMLAALAVSVELAVDGQIDFLQIAAAMVGSHALIGLGEAAIAVAVCVLLSAPSFRERSHGQEAAPLVGAVVVALLLSPFASGYPDGLEWVAAQYGFLHHSAPAFVGILSDYSIPSLSHEALSTGVAGLLGVLLSFTLAWGMSRLMGFTTAKR